MKRVATPNEYHKRIKVLNKIDDDYGLGEIHNTLQSIIENMKPPPVLIYHRKELLCIPESDPHLPEVYSVLGSDREVEWSESLCCDEMQDMNEPIRLKRNQRLRLLHVLLDDAPTDVGEGTMDDFMDCKLPLSAGEILFLKDKVGLWRKYTVQPGHVVTGTFFKVKTCFE